MGRRDDPQTDERLKFLLLCAVLALLTVAVILTAAVRLFRRPSPAEADAKLPAYLAAASSTG